jgi:hypothetical protein
MNNSQEARETTTQAQSSHGSQGAVHQRSEARTVNETENDGKSEKPYNNAQAPAGIPAVNGRRANTPVSSKVGNTQAVGAKPAVAHVPHAVTRSYHWRNSKSYSSRSRLASRSSMTRTVQQAARTH